MTGVVERAARALTDRMLRRDSYLHDAGAGDRCPCARCCVRAVILALREPSEAMLMAGGEKHSGNDYFDTKKDFEDEASAIYRAMIDAALAEATLHLPCPDTRGSI